VIRITIVAVGRRAPDWIQAGFSEYKKRLSHAIKLELTEVRPGLHRKSAVAEKAVRDEAKKILKVIPEDSFVIALDESGRKQTTQKLSARMGIWISEGRDVSFIIGGADGLHQSVIGVADELWSLSDYTLPHALVRVLLAEQLYRAWSILNNHPYHRE